MNPLMVLEILASVFGLVLGSAVTAIAYRVPRGISWFHGRSACPACKAPLGPLDLIPVLSFALSRGRCRHCSARVAWRYPLTELWCGAWGLMLFRLVGPTWLWPPLMIWGALLVALFWIDLDEQLLPDVLTFPGTLFGLAATLPFMMGARHSLLGVLAGSGLLWLLAWIWIRFRKIEGLGGGDIKLAAMFGVVLGWKLTILTLFIAAFAGSIWGGILIARKLGGGQTALPFGVLLAPAAMVALLWGDAWLGAYAKLLAGGP
ncbi:MAG: A24 family peptidase [Candidatus Eisenbacteria bacterium]